MATAKPSWLPSQATDDLVSSLDRRVTAACLAHDPVVLTIDDVDDASLVPQPPPVS